MWIKQEVNPTWVELCRADFLNRTNELNKVMNPGKLQTHPKVNILCFKPFWEKMIIRGFDSAKRKGWGDKVILEVMKPRPRPFRFLFSPSHCKERMAQGMDEILNRTQPFGFRFPIKTWMSIFSIGPNFQVPRATNKDVIDGRLEAPQIAKRPSCEAVAKISLVLFK